MRRILVLGEGEPEVWRWLRGVEEHVYCASTRLQVEHVEMLGITDLVSWGYRHILPREVLVAVPGAKVNVHISMLPWNRGADPNLWSWAQDTPRGVTIHHLDEGVDTGPVVAQREVKMSGEIETLATSYAKLQAAALELFQEQWQGIQDGTAPRMAQAGVGSVHRKADRAELAHLLDAQGWDTPVWFLLQYASETALPWWR